MQFRNDSEESKIFLINTAKEDLSTTSTPILLPGVLQSISIGGEILWDNSGSTGNENKKVAKGYKEKTVTINLLLLGEKSKTTFHILDKIIGDNPKTPYQVLKELEGLFKETEEDSEKITETSKVTITESSSSKDAVSIIPSRYIINNTHINSRGIEAVYFVNLTSSEDNAKDYIRVTITFEEILFPTYEMTVAEASVKSPV